MRALANTAGLVLLTASFCFPQAAPAPPASAPRQETPNVLLHERLEDLKAQYGKAKIDNNVSNEIVLRPKRERKTISFTGDTRTVFNGIANSYGIRATFDDSVSSKMIRLSLQDVDFEAAMNTAALMSKTFWFPIAPDTIKIAADTEKNHRDLEPVLERTFYLADASKESFNEVINALRTIFEVRFVAQQPGSNTLTVRAPQRTMHQIEQFLADLDLSHAQVMLDMQAYEVDHSLQRDVGIKLPLQFQMFSVPSGLSDLLNSPDFQKLVAQAGGLSNLLAQAGSLSSLVNSSAISALLAQYQNQLQAILANPIVLFGGGSTLFGVSVPPATVNFSRNESSVKNLEHLTLQTAEGSTATLHIGSRYPILTQSFSSGLNVAGLNIGVTGAIPGFTYEDLGITLKTKPQIHGDSYVTLDAELAIKALGNQSLNGNPIILNREYKGTITLKDGEQAVIAGILSRTEQNSLYGPAGLAYASVLSDRAQTHDDAEVLIVITPHITRTRRSNDTAAILVQ